jgi:hypothetical protein
MHTVPKAVQEEAKRALEWRKEFKIQMAIKI